jgi:uncharacterized protein (UPF0332 family)
MMNIDTLIDAGYVSKVTPAKDLAEKEFVESDYDLKSAKSELTSGNWKWSIVKAYYSMFHAARGVLFLSGLKEKSHFAVAEVMEAFVKEGKIESKFANYFRAAMSAREGADYHYKHPKHTAEEMILYAEEFCETMKMIAKKIR